MPTLETALACEVILQQPVRELFAGLFAQIESRSGERMKLLAHKLSRVDTGRASDARRNERIVLKLEHHPSFKPKYE